MDNSILQNTTNISSWFNDNTTSRNKGTFHNRPWKYGDIVYNTRQTNIIIGDRNNNNISQDDISWLNLLYNLGSYLIELTEMTSTYRCRDEGGPDKYVTTRIFCGYWILSIISADYQHMV